jgi:hypothetical protein
MMSSPGNVLRIPPDRGVVEWGHSKQAESARAAPEFCENFIRVGFDGCNRPTRPRIIFLDPITLHGLRRTDNLTPAADG